MRDYDKVAILEEFQRRVENDRFSELAEACRQVERIRQATSR